MSAALPSLAQDEREWRGAISLPWYPTQAGTELTLPFHLATYNGDRSEAVPPSEEQLAAYHYLTDPDCEAAEALLHQFHANVPELEGSDWQHAVEFFSLDRVILFRAALHGLSYAGLALSCLQWRDYGYEHGVGIVIHGDRVVHFNVAEEADDERFATRDIKKRKDR